MPPTTTPYDPLSSLTVTSQDLANTGFGYDPLSGMRATAQDIRITVDTSQSGDKFAQLIAESIQVAIDRVIALLQTGLIMTVPTVNAIINFSTGPSTAQAMQLDIGILGTNVLADSTFVIVDVSNRINRIETIEAVPH
jgi:hypothetical protein